MTLSKNDIRKYRNWLVWKVKNQPVSALTGSRTGWNKNLSTYIEARQFIEDNPEYNLGFCFSDGAPYVGLDMDACIDGDSHSMWCGDIMQKLDGWYNVSVSGTGMKGIFCIDGPLRHSVQMMPGVELGGHKPQIELFTNNKYFALTVKEFTDEDAEACLQTLDLMHLNSLFDVDVTDVSGPDGEASDGDTSPDELKALLSKINVDNYSDRDSWLKIMQASHHGTNGSDEGYELFEEWSAGDPSTFDAVACKRDWDSLNLDSSRPITIATIIKDIAPEDRPRPAVTDDFEAREMPASCGRMVSWLLCEDLRNHLSAASQFAQENLGVVRYVTDWNKWVLYDGIEWKIDSGKQVQSLIQAFLTGLRERIPEDSDDPKESAKASAWVGQQCNWNNTSGIINQCKGNSSLSMSSQELELNPNLLNMMNGTFNLETMELQEHNAADHIIGHCNVEYVKDKPCPTWERVIDDIFAGDKELIWYVQRLLGYCISGTTELEIFPVAYGDGSNGKSTVVQTVAHLLGDYAVAIPSEIFNAKMDKHPTYLARLKGARLAAVAELESDVQLSESVVKKITSQDKIEARRMREDPWEFAPSHTTLLCTNHKPKIKGSDAGIWRRIKLIPFTVCLQGREDHSIPTKLKTELSGILNWLLEGYRGYKAEGLTDCGAVNEATQEYRYGEDDFQMFLDDFTSDKVSGFFGLAEGYEAYQRQGGRKSKKNFAAEMERCGHKKIRKSISGQRFLGFEGLVLNRKGGV